MRQIHPVARLLVFGVFSIPCAILAASSTDRGFVNWEGPFVFSGQASMQQVAGFYNRRAFLDSISVLGVASIGLLVMLPGGVRRAGRCPSVGRVAILLTAGISMLMIARQGIWWLDGAVSSLIPLLYRIGNHGAAALIGGWALLAAIGGWRASDDPADIPGRILGMCWLGLTIAYWIAWAVLS